MSSPPLLFDLDGTLTDPSPGFLASIRFAMSRLGLPDRPDQELLPFIGPPLRDTIGTMLGIDDRELIEQGVEWYRERLDNGGKFEAKVIPGIPDLLEDLVAAEVPLFVCTGKPEGVANEIIDHFGFRPCFRKVYGAKLDGRHCDKADLIRHLWEVEEIEINKGALVGDTVYDMRAAKACGLEAIAVSWGFGRNEDLVAEGADTLATSVEALREALGPYLR
ncbi:MAG: HAD hydrolase-like protein [Verrucomicrobiota bacterium]